MKTTWFVIVFLTDALLFQTGLNAKLGRSLESPAYSSMVCFLVGSLAMLLYIPFSSELLAWARVRSASLVSLLGGGLGGTLFITATMLALPRIGIATTMGLVVAGQIIAAVLLDHFGIFMTQPHHFNRMRLIGIICIVLGVAIVQKF
jgi:transporter family-2 protein